MRLFVAVWPPPDVVTVLEALPRPERSGVRWTTPDQWHVTLRFFGEVDEPALDPIAAAMTTAAASVAGPFDAVLGPTTEALGRSVVCAPVSGLDEIAAAVREGTSAFGQPPEARPFHGHVTLARVPKGSPRALRGAAIEARWPVSEIHLVRSRLHPKGARYESVAVAPLR